MAAKSDAPIDRVVMIPRKADGSPAIDNFEVIGDKDFATAAAAEQLGQIAVSNSDHARARAIAAGEDVDDDEDGRIKKHKDLQVAAAKQAASEIEAAHSGEAPAAAPLERSVPVEQAVNRSSRKASQ